ncbi:MAG: GGDEF domain-containing protein [Sandaracinus sp.]|nr:GGDEF domain-containing protein [Sandaracinus sp.]MCB9636161.1 GGDEF domain-containing protein [Sandaracinus sp.]
MTRPTDTSRRPPSRVVREEVVGGRRDARSVESTGEPFRARDDVTETFSDEAVEPILAGARERLALVALVGEHSRPWIPIESDVVVGRAAECDVRLDDTGLSRRHARFFRRDGRWWVEDLGSVNGTYLDGVRLVAPEPLLDGARVQLGKGCVFRAALQDDLEQAASRRLYDSALTDPLTGLYNRRHLDARLEEELAYSRRHGTPLTVILLDVDFFKRINDTHGHAAGDAVLRVLARLIRTTVRTEDVVARYGGEEIAVLARGIDAPQGLIFADRLRKRIAGANLPWGNHELRVTASFGLATVSAARPYDNVAKLIEAADAALYRAKAEGRNRCRAA